MFRIVMKQTNKKIVAREILILLGALVIFGLFSLGLSLRNNYINDQLRLRNEKITKIESSIDSLIALPWNLNWEKSKPEVGQIYNEENSPPIDLEYAIANNNTIKLLYEESQSLKSIKTNSLDQDNIMIYFAAILFGILYLLRPIIYITFWAIKTLKK